ncbi:hypothetical protein AMECASPLE_011796 [Ameca splendens]|uniref:Uncharacterized protein n=1 Tax=Ameca splendens TaxID=208324 RepID=A0ABV0XPU4_9TELE
MTLSHLGNCSTLQFAFQSGIRVDDAIIYLLEWALTPLEKPGSKELCWHRSCSPSILQTSPSTLLAAI